MARLLDKSELQEEIERAMQRVVQLRELLPQMISPTTKACALCFALYDAHNVARNRCWCDYESEAFVD